MNFLGPHPPPPPSLAHIRQKKNRLSLLRAKMWSKYLGSFRAKKKKKNDNINDFLTECEKRRKKGHHFQAGCCCSLYTLRNNGSSVHPTPHPQMIQYQYPKRCNLATQEANLHPWRCNQLNYAPFRVQVCILIGLWNFQGANLQLQYLCTP